MGKHNGKARKSGLSVGGALVNRARKQGRDGSGAAFMHTTERAPEGNLRSVIETNDLEEMMNLASLAERDFTAERGQAVVVGWSAAEKKESECEASERAQAEARHAHRLVIPRRPEWNSSTTASALDAQERRSFLAWRRDLAELEGEERLVLTPFEKNLEVWRQLWRVVERSDAVVQVLDARDPLTYWCADLAAYAREAHPAKRCLLVLNKADLLPAAIRRDWSRYFAQRGLDFVFWSARAATQEQEAKALRQREAEAAGEHFEDSDDEYAGEEDGWDSELDAEGETGGRREVEEEEEGDEEEEEEDDEEEEGDEEEEDDEEEEEFGAESKNARPTSPSSSPLRPKPVAPFALRPASSHPAPPSHPPTKVLSAKELLGVLAALGRACRRESRALGVAPASRGSRAVVGLTGYPNVGKSSTINALFGSKKTGVAPTPGKTKHFQTLDVSDRLQLCDCPGLVMPQFAQSRAEMVAAGVLPVDRLTDVRAPVSIVAERCAPTQLERVYGLQLPSSSHAKGRATAAELLRALGRARGWVASSGLPDETRSGRRVLKDYVDGRLRYAKPPPGASRESLRAAEELALTGDGLDGQEDAVEAPYQGPSASRTREGGLDGVEEGDLSRRNKVGDVSPAAPVEPSPAPPRRADAAPRARRPADMDDADLELLEELELEAAMAAAGVRRATPARATHKFQKKPSRASQGKPKGYVDDGGNYDGAALPLGKRGGIVRVAVRD